MFLDTMVPAKLNDRENDDIVTHDAKLDSIWENNEHDD
jgi:hypothetical protein